MQSQRLATNPSLDWNMACSCTHLQQIQVWIGTLHAAAHTCNKTKSGLKCCMQSHRLSTNPSLDWNIACSHTDFQQIQVWMGTFLTMQTCATEQQRPAREGKKDAYSQASVELCLFLFPFFFPLPLVGCPSPLLSFPLPLLCQPHQLIVLPSGLSVRRNARCV